MQGDAENATILDTCLKSTFSIHAEAKELLDCCVEKSEESVLVPAKVLKRWKILAGKSNKAIRKFALSCYQAEDRRKVEAHILKTALRADSLDREASQAKVYDRFRHLSDPNITGAMERALSGAARVEEMLCMLSPTGRVQYHGAPRLSQAHASREAEAGKAKSASGTASEALALHLLAR